MTPCVRCGAPLDADEGMVILSGLCARCFEIDQEED